MVDLVQGLCLIFDYKVKIGVKKMYDEIFLSHNTNEG